MRDMSEGWSKYYDVTAERSPRATLLAALEGFAAPGLAVDLGSGDGRDAVPLLQRGWEVIAIDSEPAALARLRARPDLPEHTKLRTICARFEEADWPLCDLVNASFALPLCPRERFPALWAKIRASLKPGGRLAGQLYGKRDGWAGDPGMTHHARAEIEQLLDGLVVERLEEEESDAVTPRGKQKRWHIFHIVARRG